MIVKQEQIKKLRSVFNLNIYEAKIWTSLMSKGVATAGELSEISDVPRSRSYDVLETLEKKGFIMMKLGKPIKYIAIKPEEVVKRAKNSVEKKADEQIEMLENAKDSDTFNELQLLFKQGIEHIDPSDLAGSFKGRSNSYEQLSSLLKGAKKSITLMTTSSGLLRKVNMLRAATKKNKNVKIRVATHLNEDVEKILPRLEGIDVKNIENINARFAIVDSKHILFMMFNDDKVHEDSDSCVLVESPFFAQALEKMFNQSWR